MPLSCVQKSRSYWRRTRYSRPLQPRWSQGSTKAPTSSFPRNTVGYIQSGTCVFWTGPLSSSRSRCWRRDASFMRPSLRLGCSDRPERRLLPCLDPPSIPLCVQRGEHTSRPSPSGTSAGWGFRSTGKRANSPLCRGSLFSARSWTRSTSQHVSQRSVLSQCWDAWSLSSARGRFHWNIFRGSWGIWHPQPLSRRSDCFIWDRFSVGFTTESRDGHGATARTGSHSPRPAVAPSAHGRTLLSSGRSSPRASIQACCCFNRRLCHGLGGPCATGTQPQGSGQGPSCSGISIASSCWQYGFLCAASERCYTRSIYWSARTTLRPLRTSKRSTLPSHVATRPPSPPLESEASEVASRRSCPRRARSCSRRALTSARPSGRMATPPRGTPAELETLRGRLPPRTRLTASCFSPCPKGPSVQMHWHAAGLGAYANMRFPQWAFSHRPCARSGRTRSKSSWLRLTGPIGRGSQNWCSSRQPLLGKFLWGGIYFLREGAPSGTRAQTCGISTYGPWTGRGGSKWATSSGSKHYHFCHGPVYETGLQAEVEPVRRLVFSPPGGPP